MNDGFYEIVLAELRQISPLEAVAVAFGVLYLLLAIRQNIACWYAALLSSVLSIVVMFEARLYQESGLQVFYAAMAVYGWYQWRLKLAGPSRTSRELPIRVWPPRVHVAAIGGTLVASAATGWVFTHTDAAFPYLDSFITVASLVTTYMVAKKILENWIYWLVIDSLSLYVYVMRDLPLYAALIAVYLVLVVVGFMRWQRDWREQSAPAVS
jgi:nicotinamide mononucleotide transporter